MDWLTDQWANIAIQLAWLSLALFWMWMWRQVKPTKRREAAGLRFAYIAILLVGVALILARPGLRSLAYSPELGGIAVAINWMGILFAIWARVYLGTNWSSTVTVKEGHELIRSGPYALVRHPIYCGMLFGWLGLALERGRWTALIGVCVIFVGFRLKSRTEERFMREQFGEKYEEYRRRTAGLIPFVI
jgi:protein-S-isoprenylcysteine O-methyltransferase Ste14